MSCELQEWMNRRKLGSFVEEWLRFVERRHI